jgi:hypothetical protein
MFHPELSQREKAAKMEVGVEALGVAEWRAGCHDLDNPSARRNVPGTSGAALSPRQKQEEIYTMAASEPCAVREAD